MKHTRMFMALLLCLAMILPACSQTQTENPSDTTASTADTTVSDADSPYDANGFLKDDLPEDLNFGGKEVNIFVGDYNGAYIDDLYVEAESGDRLSDAIYTLRRRVEERLGVKLTYNWETYPYSKLSSHLTTVTTNIMSGDQSFDLLFDMSPFAYKQLEGEYFLDLADTKYIDLEKPWYNQSVIEMMPGDDIFFIVGDFSLNNVKNAFATYFNADLYEDLGKTENLYDIVDSGNWTMEKMETIISDVYADLNGNGEVDYADRFGLSFGDGNKYLGYLYALNVKMFTRTNDGYEFTYGNEHAVDVANRCMALVHENINVVPAQKATAVEGLQIESTGGNYISKVFVEGRSLFSKSLVADAGPIVGEIDFEYGLLPYPKWDAAQENYQTALQRRCYALIPSSTFKVDEASAVLEAMSSESYRYLVPEYCEVMLKTRYAQDNDVARMFDLIGDSIVEELGTHYTRGTPEGLIRSVMYTPQNWASLIESKRQSLVTEMDKVFEAAKAAG